MSKPPTYICNGCNKPIPAADVVTGPLGANYHINCKEAVPKAQASAPQVSESPEPSVPKTWRDRPPLF